MKKWLQRSWKQANQSGDGLATAALLLGISGLALLGPITGIPAIIAGHAARKRHAGHRGSRAFRDATVGMWAGYCTLLLLPVLVLLLWILVVVARMADVPLPFLL
jgi:hypothetical protein